MNPANRGKLSVPAILCVAMLAATTCTPVLAALGAGIDSVEVDRQQMRGQVQVVPAAGYTVHQIVTPTTTVVKEYVSATGLVFAVSWQGPLLPDLRQTLGSYFDEFQKAARPTQVGHRHLDIEHSDLVVHSSGRMRAFYGVAYVPSLLPPNFSLQDVK